MNKLVRMTHEEFMNHIGFVIVLMSFEGQHPNVKFQLFQSSKGYGISFDLGADLYMVEQHEDYYVAFDAMKEHLAQVMDQQRTGYLEHIKTLRG